MQIMDNFREWLSDNLRYILLGLAVILLLIIAFFAIKLVRGIGSPKTSEPETQAVTETVTEAAKDDSENKLVKETADSELQQLVEQYYTAVAAQDYDTLQSISESFTDEDKKKVENASAIESYNNIAVYSKKGLTDGTYIVYAYCDAKITGIETTAPRLVCAHKCGWQACLRRYRQQPGTAGLCAEDADGCGCSGTGKGCQWSS